MTSERKRFVYIAYIDDSGSTGANLKDSQSPFQVVTAVVVQDSIFRDVEFFHASIIEQLVPDNEQDNFEFHANELFWGQGHFRHLGQQKAREWFASVLHLVNINKLPVVYGAVDKPKLLESRLASAIPIDVAFRVCSEGIEKWLSANAEHGLGLFIADDTKNQRDKDAIKLAFRQLRTRLKIIRPDEAMQIIIEGESAGRTVTTNTGRLMHILDDIYFGDSRDSVGIQLADMCGYVIHRHLRGKQDSEYLYEIIRDRVVAGEVVTGEEVKRNGLG